jgi:uncharacterized protein (TIGR00255 family)
MTRGSLDVRIEFLPEAQVGVPEVRIREPLLEEYSRLLSLAARKLAHREPTPEEWIRLTPELLRMPGLMELVDRSLPEEQLWNEVETLLKDLTDQALQSRKFEGEKLHTHLLSQLSHLEELHSELSLRLGSSRTDRLRARVEDRIRLYLTSLPQEVRSDRVAEELALILDRSDVTEELTRLGAHLSHFREILKNGGPVGKKIEFLSQELTRELNTLATKAQDSEVSQRVIDGKLWVEQIREQALNLQ